MNVIVYRLDDLLLRAAADALAAADDLSPETAEIVKLTRARRYMTTLLSAVATRLGVERLLVTMNLQVHHRKIAGSVANQDHRLLLISIQHSYHNELLGI